MIRNRSVNVVAADVAMVVDPTLGAEVRPTYDPLIAGGQRSPLSHGPADVGDSAMWRGEALHGIGEVSHSELEMAVRVYEAGDNGSPFEIEDIRALEKRCSNGFRISDRDDPPSLRGQARLPGVRDDPSCRAARR